MFDKTAVLFRSVVKNHPLVDGNKRLGLTCAFIFLLVNGYLFWMPRAEAVAFAVDVVEGSLDAAEIARRLRRGAARSRSAGCGARAWPSAGATTSISP